MMRSKRNKLIDLKMQKLSIIKDAEDSGEKWRASIKESILINIRLLKNSKFVKKHIYDDFNYYKDGLYTFFRRSDIETYIKWNF